MDCPRCGHPLSEHYVDEDWGPKRYQCWTPEHPYSGQRCGCTFRPYFCDNARHLVCWPYSVENLHAMAADLGIKRCWFHGGSKYPHYDIPKRRIAEIKALCIVVSSREILAICNGELGPE